MHTTCCMQVHHLPQMATTACNVPGHTAHQQDTWHDHTQHPVRQLAQPPSTMRPQCSDLASLHAVWEAATLAKVLQHPTPACIHKSMLNAPAAQGYPAVIAYTAY